MNPRVTVIIPCHNYGHFLPDAAGSVFRQRFQEWECLIVDDASTDETPAIADAWAEQDKRFGWIRLHERQGLCGANNAAVEELKRQEKYFRAASDYLLFLYADDLLYPCALEALVSALDTHPAYPAAAGYSTRTHFGEERESDGWPLYYSPTQVDIHFEQIVNRCPICTPGQVLIRRDAFEAVGGFDERLECAEDWDLWLRLSRIHPLLLVQSVVHEWRMGIHNTSENRTVMDRDEAAVRSRIPSYREGR